MVGATVTNELTTVDPCPPPPTTELVHSSSPSPPLPPVLWMNVRVVVPAGLLVLWLGFTSTEVVVGWTEWMKVMVDVGAAVDDEAVYVGLQMDAGRVKLPVAA